MQNWQTVAITSALLGGMATFVLGTSKTQFVEREFVRDVPARLPDIAARPVPQSRSADERSLDRSPVEPSRSGAVEHVAYANASNLTAIAPALLAQTTTTTTTTTVAGTPKIEGLYNANSATDPNKIKPADFKTKVTSLFINVEFPSDPVPKGVLTVRIGKNGTLRETNVNISANSAKVQLLEVNVASLEMKAADDIVVLWDPDDVFGQGGQIITRSLPSDPAKVWIDNVPPRIQSVKLIGETGGVGVLEVQFANNDLQDLKNGTLTVNSKPTLIVTRTGGQHTFGTAHDSVTLLDRAADSFVARLNLGSLVTDLYQLEGTVAIIDQHGNTLAEPRKFTFNSMPEAVRGPHVPFPEFVRRKEQQPQDIFNPGDKVETRVARLYYIRDAHRVAQIINRNTKAYNQSGVESAKLTAKNARESAEQATRDRQIKERDAIRTTEATREVERNLAAARQQLEQTRAMFGQQVQANDQIAAIPKQFDPKLEEAKRTVTAKNDELQKLKTTLTDLNTQIQAQQKISDGKAVDIEVLQAQLANPAPNATLEKLKADKKAAEEKQGVATALIARYDARMRILQARINPNDPNNPDQVALKRQIGDLQSLIDAQQLIVEDQDLIIAQLDYKIAHPSTPTTDVDLKSAKSAKELADKQVAKLTSQRNAVVEQIKTTQEEYDDAKKVVAAAEAKATGNPNALTPVQFKAEIQRLAGAVAAMEKEAAQKRQAEQAKQESSEQAQEIEDRARENQFRAEVAAGTVDPDTYVPGDVQSEDPVTQVSISVIGEGVLQLRGPIRGINKIRTMINQIDSPLGQVKVGIFTVQVNGEHGDRMEKVATRIEGHIDLSRFLTNQSLGYLRRAIQEVAGTVVANVDAQFPDQHRQIDRDRKYLYAFFGRDFIDELYEMDSEFLRTENKLLSLHGMDTVSQSQACFIMALSKNDIRQQILDRFRGLVECDLPQAEWDYRRTSRLLPCKLNSQKEVCRNAFEKYKFRNVHGFFEASVYASDTMTPMQREFIRLAQIFKSQMVAEVELKQRVIERGLIEDASNSDQEKARLLDIVHAKALQRVQQEFEFFVESSGKEVRDLVTQLQIDLNSQKKDIKRSTAHAEQLLAKLRASSSLMVEMLKNAKVDYEENTLKFLTVKSQEVDVANLIDQMHEFVLASKTSSLLRPKTVRAIQRNWNLLLKYAEEKDGKGIWNVVERSAGGPWTGPAAERADAIIPMVEEDLALADSVLTKLYDFGEVINDPRKSRRTKDEAFEALKAKLDDYLDPVPFHELIYRNAGTAIRKLRTADNRIQNAEATANRVRRDLDHRKLLEFLIDEQEEKCIELLEGMRSHIAQIDTYLKRLAIALEDDFKVQFYDPAFAGVRAASREWDVNLGQVERTTILTNNRQFAKVSPQATMEFDLPKRAPMIVEGMNGARALVQEYGTLLQDPTFLSLSGMMSGSPVSAATGGSGTPLPGQPNQGLRIASVRTVLPGQSTDSSEQLMAQSGGPDRKFGASLEALIPDPAIYKFETGTGFEIRPVIQPDGHSVIYDFDYMYTTNVREPVRPDEKHLGRVKRHFIHTQVQTSSFELREISRYQVALKASRTSRGVPLLEDIPGAGVLFRPLPSDESSLQQNIILAQSTVYPTLFDLMGLRWSEHVVDLDHIGLRDLEHVTRGREQSIHDFTFDEASKRVDQFLDIQNKEEELHRPDLYRQQRQPSPYHPGGFQYQSKDFRTPDPQNRSNTIPDRRPEEYRVPDYDALRRNPIDRELRQVPTPGAQPENIDLRIPPAPEVVPLPGSSSRSKPRETSSPVAKKVSAATPKTPAATTIQPASFEQSTRIPQVSDDDSGRSHVTSPAVDTQNTTQPKKKSWIGALKPAFKK